MKILSMIRFKPKPEYFDEYLTALKDRGFNSPLQLYPRSDPQWHIASNLFSSTHKLGYADPL
jgi:hypothetical protein